MTQARRTASDLRHRHRRVLARLPCRHVAGIAVGIRLDACRPGTSGSACHVAVTAGRDVFFHVCGQADAILDDLFDLGVWCLWAQIACYDAEAFTRRLADRGVSTYIHPDRQRLVPRGAPAEIERRIAEHAERHHRLGGGGIFYVEIENDAPWENVRTLIESIHKYR